MHIVIGVLGAIAGLIWALVALQRSGIDVGWLNPFAWYHRSQWRKKYADKPIYALNDPMDVAAVLLLGTAKCEGEVSVGQKQAVLDIFTNDFGLSDDDAADLLLASSHLIRDEVYLVDNLGKIFDRTRDRFSPDQIQSTLSLMRRVANLEGQANAEQQKLIDATERYFSERLRRKGAWN